MVPNTKRDSFKRTGNFYDGVSDSYMRFSMKNEWVRRFTPLADGKVARDVTDASQALRTPIRPKHIRSAVETRPPADLRHGRVASRTLSWGVGDTACARSVCIHRWCVSNRSQLQDFDIQIQAMIVRGGTSFPGLRTALPLPRYFGGPPRLSVSFLHDGPAGIRVGQSGTLTSLD